MKLLEWWFGNKFPTGNFFYDFFKLFLYICSPWIVFAIVATIINLIEIL